MRNDGEAGLSPRVSVNVRVYYDEDVRGDTVILQNRQEIFCFNICTVCDLHAFSLCTTLASRRPPSATTVKPVLRHV